MRMKKNRSKNKLVVIVVAFIMTVFPLLSSADDIVEYYVAEGDVRVALPAGFLYADRNVDEKNAFCAAVKMTRQDFVENYLTDDTYMVAYAHDTGIFLTLMIRDTDKEDFTNLSDSEIEAYYSWVDLFGERLNEKSVVRYKRPYYYWYATENKTNSSQYSTVVNRREYVFDFMENVSNHEVVKELYDTIISFVTFPEGNNDTANIVTKKTDKDPVLSVLPNISWGMSKESVLSKNPDSGLIDMSTDEKSILAAFTDIYNDSVVVMVSFENNKIKSVSAVFSEEKREMYMTDLAKVYGTAVRTTSYFAYSGLSGDIVEVKDGDVFAWKTTDSLIMLSENSVIYCPLK